MISRYRLQLTLVLLVLLSYFTIAADPPGATISFNDTVTRVANNPEYYNTTGGTITTLLLNVTMQNPRWKAYVGNITGTFVLDDADNYTIYDWDITDITGRVYASRTDDLNWSLIRCANSTQIAAEEIAINHTASSSDSISSTFDSVKHKEFYVAGTYIANSSCSSLVTFVNDSRQTISEEALFQEVLLSDETSMIYTALAETDKIGYRADNLSTYDFQMIVAENAIPSAPNTAYYFYVELT